MFKLNYNVTKIKFNLYLLNNEKYNDEKMVYLKKYCLIIKKLNLIYFHIYKYMNYYRKPINKVIDYVKLKIQLGALTLKLSENNKKIDDSIGVDKNIKKDVSSNTSKIDNNKNDISTNLKQISTNTSSISTNSSQISTNTGASSTNLKK